MKIFITGIAGFLGSNLAEYYLRKNFTVAGCDNLVGGNLENINNLDLSFHKGDCEDLNFMNKVLKGFDVVVHCAAYPHEGLSSFSPNIICKNIFAGSVSVFTAAIKNKLKRIVFCSSMARYGDIETPFKENNVIKPVDPYGISKVAAEDVLKVLSKTHDIEYNIAVPHNIIGPKQRYIDPYRNVVSIMINLILQNRQPIIYGDGNQKRNFSDVDDCIYCLDKLIVDDKIVNEIYNIGPDEETISINDLYKTISNKLKFNLPAIYKPDRPNEVKFAFCSSEKAKNDLNYKTNVSLSDSIDKLIEYIKAEGPKNFDYNFDIEIINKKTPETWFKKLF